MRHDNASFADKNTPPVSSGGVNILGSTGCRSHRLKNIHYFSPGVCPSVVRILISVYLNGAGDGIRTRDTKLGKLVLYQLSYARIPKIIIAAGLCLVNPENTLKDGQ
jgi:hypothetical protein